MAASSYHASPLEQRGEGLALVAANRDQHYRTTFRRSGIEINSKPVSGHDWRLGISLTAFGHAGGVRPLPSAEPVAEKGRVEYQRGPVTEWYENRPSGLEQGFTIAEPEMPSSQPLVLAMAVEGGLHVQLDGKDAASFQDSAGRTRVRYAGLAAWDADLRPLTCWLEASARELRVLVETGEARFPVTVDPSFVQESKIEGHGDVGVPEAGAGYSVSVSGDTAVVGAYLDNTAGGVDAGSASVFVRSGTAWSEQQKLLASDGTTGDKFGYSVSVSGDTAVVGAFQDDTPGGVDAGSAYVFVRSGTVWSQEQKLVASDGGVGDYFGNSVSVSGDTAVVGVYGEASAYAFVRSGTVWSQQQKLEASDGAAFDAFGISVSVSGDTVVVGARSDDTTDGSDAGSAYVFVRSGIAWSEQQKLVASDGAANDYFGYSVSLAGDTAVVGAYGDDTAGGSDAGSAYVFVRSGTVWSEQQKLVASDGADFDHLGISVSVSGDTAIVGAWLDDTVSQPNVGSAYVFVRSGTVWSEQQKLVASDGGNSDWFGISVSVSGDTAVVGAYGDDTAGGWAAGSAYAFVRSGTVWSEQQKLVASLAPDSAAGDLFGHSVSVSGDTAVVGAVQDDTARGVNSGSAYVFVRSGTVWSQQQKLMASSGAASDYFGSSVSVSGDTIVVGAPGHDPSLVGGAYEAGSAYVFVRSGTVWSEQQQLFASDGEDFDLFGVSVSVSVDTVVVGDSLAGVAGLAYVFVRSGAVWNLQQKLMASASAADNSFASSVSVSGDTAVVGASRDDTAGGSDAGSAYVFVRSGTVWSQQQKLVASDGAAFDEFGISVSVSDNTVVVGARSDMAGGSDAGSAYVFVRSGTVWSQQQKLVASDGAAFDEFGTSVAVSGNTVVVGARSDDTTDGSDAGSAYVFVRSGTVWSEQQKLVVSDGAVGDNFGTSVSVSGDIALAGAPGDDTAGGADTGSAYVFRVPAADLSVTKTDGVASVVPGGSLTYTIGVANAGPYPVVGANIADALPAALTCSTTCSGTGGATCTAGPFVGSINDTVSIPAGQAVTYTSSCTVSLSFTGMLTNTATVTVPPTVSDANLANNSSSDVDVVGVLVSGTKTVSGSFAELGAVAYTVTLTNAGTVQGDNAGDEFSDTLPSSLMLVSANASSGATGTSGNTVTWNGSILAGGSVTIAINATINAGTAGLSISNQGTISFDANGDGTNEANALTDDPGVPGASDPTVFQTVSGPIAFYTVTPCRVLDTRDVTGSPALSAGAGRVFTIVGDCEIPATATAVSVNIAVTGASAPGNLRLHPGGTPVPFVAAINYAVGQTRANNAVVLLNPSGQIGVFCSQASGTVHLILDVNGYFQ